MSKLILWVGFLLSCAALFMLCFVVPKVKLVPLALWSTIFFGSGYKLFFKPPRK